MSIPDGFRQGTEPFMSIPDGFRQGTEPFMSIPDSFRQGTEPFLSIPKGFRQGTEPTIFNSMSFKQGAEPSVSIPDGFRQGTEPFMPIPDGFRQGTEPVILTLRGFRQETEPSRSLPRGFRQGTEPSLNIPEGLRQGTEPLVKHPEEQGRSTPSLQTCQGEVINGNCYEFNPTPLNFQEAQDLCKARNTHAELASVTSGDLHSRLVSMVTKGGQISPRLTWLGAVVKNQQASWVDGSEWTYSDWMPGQPNIHTSKPVCVEMFKIDESWWTAVDCDLKRASICSYPAAA
ncbi:lectin-like [Nerophis ophidion]|uniref:lectin-like n=1 Tax=Nerophis ophidion TaxID=159077 RepID=UPI002ADF69D4|nr:lectin-like [Nerophis ophidion]